MRATRTLRVKRQHINVGKPSDHSWVHTRKSSSETFTHHRSSCATSLLQQFRSPNNFYFAPIKQYRRLHTETVQTTTTPKPPSRSKRILDSAEHLDPQDPWYGIVQNEYEQVIQNLAKRGDVAKMMYKFGEMNKKGIQPSLDCFHTVMEVFAAHKDTEQLVYMLKAMPSKSLKPVPKTYEIIINTFAQLGDTKMMMKTLNTMKKDKVEPSVEILGIVVDCLARKQEELKTALEICDDIKKKGIVNLQTLNSVLLVLSRGGEIEQMEKLLLDATKGGIQPDSSSYSIMMDAFNSKEQSEKSIALFKQLEQSGIPIATPAYNSLLSALQQQGDIDTLKAKMAEMKDKNITRDLHTFLPLLKAYGNKGDTESMMNLFEEMKKEVTPDVTAYNEVISILSANNMTAEMTTMFDKMEDDKISPNRDTYQYLLQAFARSGDIESVGEVLADMSAQKIPMDIDSFNSLVEVYCVSKDFQKALSVFSDMESLDIRPNRTTFGIMFEYCETKQQIGKVLDKMKEYKIAWTTHLYESLISAFVKCKDLQEILDVFHAMRKKGHPWSRESCCALLYLLKESNTSEDIAARTERLTNLLIERDPSEPLTEHEDEELTALIADLKDKENPPPPSHREIIDSYVKHS